MPKHASFAVAVAAATLLLLPALPGLGRAEAQMTMSLASAGRGGGVNAIIEGYHHSIEVPQDALTARATGRRQHSPLTVTKTVDRATPLLYRAMSGSETIPSVTIRVPTSQGRGGQPVIITLTNARIVGIESSAVDGTSLAREDVSFIYEKIKWASAEGGTEFEDSWRENR
ncbi:MAG: Hcp family type VI secretion system effector [Gemmatimonadota bacterium]